MAAGAASGRRLNTLPRQGETSELTPEVGVTPARPRSIRLRLAADSPGPRTPGDVLLRDGAGRPCAFGGEASGRYWVRVPEVGTYELSPNADEVVASAFASTPPTRLVEAYYGTALPLFAQAAFGYEVLHASAVLVDGAAVAFCAWTGVGKSTIRSGLSRRGFEPWADDALALAPRDSDAGPLVSVFLPFIRRGAVVSPPVSEQVPVRAVFLLERIESNLERRVIEDRSPADTFAALVSHAYRFGSQTPERRRRVVETYLAVSVQAQIFSLGVKHDLDELPQLLDRIESMLSLSIGRWD